MFRIVIFRIVVAAALAALPLQGCVQNPVTGERDFVLVSEAWELEVGREQYAPLRQSQGGDYTADPEVEAYVREVGARLAAVSDRELPYEFNVINDGTPNAWALPGGKISINRGLLQTLETEAELAAVLGHEIVHAAARHGARGQTRGLALQGGVLLATVLGDRYDYGAIAQLGSMVGARIINSRYGRGAEFESDRYGMEYMARAGYDPEGAVELQRKFVELSKDRRQDFLSGLFASHPPSERRVAANQETAATLPDGGEVGAERYRAAMARLARAAPAYERYEQAQAALETGERDAARRLVEEAIDLEPREGHFHALLGQIARNDGDFDRAERYFDRAIALNDDFYAYFLQRGLTRQASGALANAKTDLARSNELLATAPAFLALGEISEREGDLPAAERAYATAAQGGGDIAERARAALRGLPLPPGTAAEDLVAVRTGLSRDGEFVIQLANESSREIGDIVLQIDTPTRRGQSLPLRGSLEPGDTELLRTGQRLDEFTADQVSVRVVRAEAIR